MNQIWTLVAFLVVCFGAAALGSYFTTPSIPGWYESLNRPNWTPPNWVFGPVWSLLYLCMALAAWLVWRRLGFQGAWVPLSLFGLQLVLNVAWSVIFFGLRSPGWAFMEILSLAAAILATLVAFWVVTVWAGLLMVPYLMWVAFAAALNFAIWRMNP